jgi:SAM-dependent methyltransferase
MTLESVREAVRTRYAAAARAVSELPVVDAAAGCCAPGADAECCTSEGEVSSNLYAVDELSELPSSAVLASLGCGNPTALAELQPGETVLDLGSGGGIDVLLSARRVGATGFAYGLDMTDTMLELARHNAVEAGTQNVAFLKGEIAAIPLPDASVDVIISNCVINLSADKPRVIAEAFRVLRPDGRFAVSDVVVQGRLADEVRRDMELWAGCVAGALDEDTYTSLLSQAGFEQVGVEVTRVYERHQTAEGRLVSAFVRATKPHA